MEPVSAAASVRALLDLLHRDAPAVEFERPVLEARAAGAGEEVIAELEAAKRTALRISGVLDQRRRRESELAALNETANDLAGLRDPDRVLHAIVHRARSLLGTDTAYLSLHDPIAGDTYLRVTAGSVSTRFQRLRLAMGEGLGGLVAQLGTPYVTDDYFDDTRFRHTHTIDDGVRDEGLVAILGVPLLLGKTVIGVLFASDRRPRVFGPDEISLLCSMAAHAAIAIDTANLLDKTRSALADLARANEQAIAHTRSVERAAQAHDRFTELALAGAGVDDVARAAADVLGGAASLLPAEAAHARRPAGSAEHAEPAGPPPGPPAECADPTAAAERADAIDVDAALERARRTGRVACVGRVQVALVSAGGERLGALVLRHAGDAEAAAADPRILERAAATVALLLLFRRSVTDTEHRLRGELLQELLTAAGRDAPALADRATRLGTDLTRPHIVVVLDAPDADRTRLTSAIGHLAATAHGLAGDHDGRPVLLLPGDRPSAGARRVAAELGSALGRPVTAGAAGPIVGVEALADAHTEARRCLESLRALGRHGEGASTDDLGFLGLLLAQDRDLQGFVDRTIGPLLDYDHTRGTELTRTVSVYLDSANNLSRTREQLHVHVNTVSQRLDRVARLLGTDWNESERALQIRLALHLRTMLPPRRFP